MANNGSSPAGAVGSAQPGPTQGSLSPAVPASIRPRRQSVAVPAGRGPRILAQEPVIDGYDLKQMLIGNILLTLVNVRGRGCLRGWRGGVREY